MVGVRACCLAWLFALPAHANSPLQSLDDWRYGVLVDPGGRLAVEQVAALTADQFQPQQGPYAAGYQPTARWFRLDWPAQVPTGQRYWLEIWPAFLDQLDVYHWRNGAWVHQPLGDLRSRDSRTIDHRHHVAEIRPDSAKPVWVRLQTSSTTVFMAALWTPDDFTTHATEDALLWGAYFGVGLLAMAMVMGLAFYLRSPKLGAIGVFATGFLLVASNQGYLSWLLFPGQIQLGHQAGGVLVLLSQSASLWLVAFTLDFRQHRPRLHRAYQVAAAVLLLATLSVPLGWYNQVIGGFFLLATTFQLASIAIGWQLWRRLRSYGMVTLGYAVYTFSSLLAVVTVTGLVPFHAVLYEFWQYVLTGLMLGIAYFALLQVRDDQVRALSEATSRLLATREARDLLSQQVAQRTRELEQTRDALQVALINEQEARAQERQFIGILSHEFRTPLAIIHSAVEVMEFTAADDAERQAECLQHIRNANQRLVQLTDTCLADARFDRGMQQIDWQRFHWDWLVQTSADQLGLRLGVDVRMTEDAPDTWRANAHGDTGLLRILLCNLLDNARKYSALQPVTVGLQADAQGWRLQVTDHGPGMAQADWERIFERFVRLPDTRALEGSGLGLYVCRQIARAHGGDVRVAASRPGHTTFELALPRQAEGTQP